MVWPSTTEMGIAAARGQDSVYYVVARYSPAGNMVGESPLGR